MKNLLPVFFLFALIAGCSSSHQSPRIRSDFGAGWKFQLGDTAAASDPAFDDRSWRLLDVPHDWSIEGEFSNAHPATPGGGALPGGIGWYRKHFTTGDLTGKQLFIDFDGVYRNSEVWINGHYLGKRPFGYISFRYDLTPYLRQAGQDNLLAVRVDNSAQPNSRWYSGSGIYRNVWLVTADQIHIPLWGTYVTTPEVSKESATISVRTKVRNAGDGSGEVQIRTLLADKTGKKIRAVVSEKKKMDSQTTLEIFQKLVLENPDLWSTDKPVLYTVISQILVDNQVVDETETALGIRWFEFDAEKGFSLNGKRMKINGVCNHHDLGCLGAAINVRAIERQLEILKEMGVNSIRTSHNPPAPELLDLCDRMGILVMDEAFDVWRKSKSPFDYALDFDEWHQRDLQDMILRDRNHPSVFVWSIGNEIPEQWDSTGIQLARDLSALVKMLDPTRPVTSGLNDPEPHNYIIRSDSLDLIGYNYKHTAFALFPQTFRDGKFIATETVSALMTRGEYDLPSDVIRRWPVRSDYQGPKPNENNYCSSYDNCSAPWGSTHEETWKEIKKQDFLSGQYIWTGFDYLGEPTPYWWPSRSSYFGIVDLAGFPKDVYYMYQSEWTKKDVLHIFPHWNWNQGDTIDVWAYASAPEVELFLNDNSLGAKTKEGDALHLAWRVAWEPGVLKAVSRKEGKEVLTKEIRTAGDPARIRLVADRAEIISGGKDLSFVTVEILDKEGNPVPKAGNLVNFEIKGGATLAATDNGDPTNHASFRAPFSKAFNGKCLAVVRSSANQGVSNLTAPSDGLEVASIEIIVK